MTNQKIGMPARIARLPRDAKGRPVPFFVLWKDGVPDFRVVDPLKIQACVHRRVCWICGERLGKFMAFVIGPLCSVSRLSAEPPGHLECAQYAALICPFLANPNLQRHASTIHTLEEVDNLPGSFVAPNPGVTLVWVTTSFRVLPDSDLLFSLGDPTTWFWYTRGRPATRSEVEASFAAGLDKLRNNTGTQSRRVRFEKAIAKAKELWPPAEGMVA
jgi:hypothetical protein